MEEEIYQKKEPTNKVKSTNKDEERNGKGRRKNGGVVISPIFFGEASHCWGCLAMFQGFN